MKHGRRTSRSRTTTRHRIVAGIVTCAAIGALTGTGIASATSAGTRMASVKNEPTQCWIAPQKLVTPVAVVLEADDNSKRSTLDGKYDIDRLTDLWRVMSSGYEDVKFYLWNESTAPTLLTELSTANSQNFGATPNKVELSHLNGRIIVNYTSLEAAQFSDAVLWIPDYASKKAFPIVNGSSNVEHQDPASVSKDSWDSGDIVFSGTNGLRKGSMILLPEASSNFELDGTAINNPAKPVRVTVGNVAVTIGDTDCGLSVSAEPSDGRIPSTTMESGNSIDLTLPATLHWSGGSGIGSLGVTLQSNQTELVEPTLSLEPDGLNPSGSLPGSGAPEDSAPSSKRKAAETPSGSKVPANDKPDSSSGPILAGGVIGLLVGGGAGAALMASRRRNDGTQPGFGTGMAVAGGPPHPYGPGPGGYTTAPATDAWGNPIMASATPPPGPAVADLARAKRTDQTPREWTVAVPGGTAVRLDDVGTARLMPRVTDNGVVWAMGRQDVAATSGWFEKRRGKGEDAEPTLRIHSSGRGIIGVYDGTGGAGATVARTTGDGTELSGAWVASRLVRDVVESWFAIAVSEGDRALETGELASTLHKVLADEATHLPAARTGVRGSLHRVLPTTAACVAFDAGANGGTIDALWAGDSRAFVLSPGSGLQALTRDDTREDDALELIRNDQPMENLIAADRPFRVNHRRYGIASPIVLVTATDGAFGYVRTPAHFEYLLLHALVTADSMNDWSARLLAAFAEFAADDVSFSMAAIGFASFAELKAQLAARHDYLAAEHWKPFVDNTGDAEAIERLREDSWKVYKDLYVEKLSEPDVAIGAEQRPAGQ